jgi:hypothetical protein
MFSVNPIFLLDIKIAPNRGIFQHASIFLNDVTNPVTDAEHVQYNFFYPEFGTSKFLQNVANRLPNNTASHPKTL